MHEQFNRIVDKRNSLTEDSDVGTQLKNGSTKHGLREHYNTVGSTNSFFLEIYFRQSFTKF